MFATYNHIIFKSILSVFINLNTQLDCMHPLYKIHLKTHPVFITNCCCANNSYTSTNDFSKMTFSNRLLFCIIVALDSINKIN